MTRAATAPEPADRVVRLGFTANTFSSVNLDDAMVAMQLWTRELAIVFAEGYSGVATIYDDLDKVTTALDDGAVDLINLPTLDYLSIQDHYRLEPALVGQYIDGQLSERYIIVVHEQSGFATLEDLEGKDLLVGIPGDKRTCRLWLDVLLARQGRSCSSDHFRMHSAETASQAVLPVFFGQKEAGVVTGRAFETMAELNPQIGQQLKIVATSPDLTTGILFISSDCSPDIRELTVNSGMKMHETAQGQHILELFGMKRIAGFEPHHLNGVKSLLDEYERAKVGEPAALMVGWTTFGQGRDGQP